MRHNVGIYYTRLERYRKKHGETRQVALASPFCILAGS